MKKVREDLYWVGGNDRRLALFENIYPLSRGVSYNSYLLLDEQTLQGTLYKGNDALLYLRATFAELGDYKQAKEIAGRFSQDDSFVGTCEGKAVDADGQETPVQGYTVWTDAQGRLLAAHNIRYTYDENGHLTEEQKLEAYRELGVEE